MCTALLEPVRLLPKIIDPEFNGKSSWFKTQPLSRSTNPVLRPGFPTVFGKLSHIQCASIPSGAGSK